MFRIGLPELTVLTFFGMFFLVLLLPLIFYLLTLQKALARCAPANRTMEPGLVWLTMIPLFNLIWNFFVVSALSKSLGNEFRARQIQTDAEPGRSIGLAFAILFACAIVPLLGILATLAGFVLWIIYWVKISEYSSKLA